MADQPPALAVRITLECAHLRLVAPDNAGIGDYTACRICQPDTVRLIVNVEPTDLPYTAHLELPTVRPFGRQSRIAVRAFGQQPTASADDG